MGFTEITFMFVFMPISIIIYVLADRVFNNILVSNTIIAVLSLLFYFWANKKSLLVFAMIVILTYAAGCVAKTETKKDKSNRITKYILTLVGILAFYKYITFISDWITSVINEECFDAANIVVPIGLSFVIFSSISYIVDIYRGQADVGSLVDCFIYLCFFPKLVAGPIVLWKDFESQLRYRVFSIKQISYGVDRIIIGYAKKAILADTFGYQLALINSRFLDGGVDTLTMWLRGLLFFFQLYFDFSGYSDIAIGLCNIWGFSIKENFNYPYLSMSISEFWRRWHISLGTWFREYVYIPLGGNRQGNVYIHLMIVFLLTGIWHGSSFNYIILGGVNGLLVVIERIIKDKAWYKKTPIFLKWFLTIIIVFFSWIIFATEDIYVLPQILKTMFSTKNTDINFSWQYYLTNRTIIFLIIAIVGHILGMNLMQRGAKSVLNTNVGIVLKRIVLLAIFIIDILYVINSSYRPFMYFQF